jgi:hypothetical protein
LDDSSESPKQGLISFGHRCCFLSEPLWRLAKPIALCLEGFDLYPTYLAQIASAAEKACALTIERPKDPRAREHLFDALAPVADPAFQADDPDFNHLTDLFSQARVWAEIVRTRITGLSTNKSGHLAIQAIQYPARDLLPILGDLSRELARSSDA